MNTALAYDDDEEYYELIHGQEVDMSAASMPHLKVQKNLFRLIDRYLTGKYCEIYFEAKVVLDDKNWLQPDLVVVCAKEKIKLNHIEGAPDFVCEIISPTTQYRDFGVKKDLYEKFGVTEYWIVDPIGKNIFVHILKEGKYELTGIYHKFSSEEWEGLSEREKSRQKLTLKISLYDDLEINVNDVFKK